MPTEARLFLLSFLLLFLELVLIRWTSAFVVYLSYFTNFVLLASFFGIGIGFLRPRLGLFGAAPLALAALVGLVYAFPTRLSHSAGGRLLYFGASQHTGGTPIWLALPVIFLLVALVLALIAGEAARAFRTLAPLRAYRYDVLGSIAGICTFALLSYFALPPLVWGAVVVAVFLVLLAGRLRPLQILGLAGLLVPLGFASFGITWSPYYAIKVVQDPHRAHVYRVLVNGVPHQTIEPIALRRAGGSDYYFVPYERIRRNPLRNVLVVGAGNGTDVAVALRSGARHVDAVEIDPQLLAIGRRLNVDRPYADPRVTSHATDGRAFLERTHRRYDLIVFALPDSLTLIANQSSLRLESYLFTADAFRAVRAHLTGGGAFAMYNFYRRQWLVDRFAHTLEQVFGHPPCLDEELSHGATLGPMANLTIGTSPRNVRCKQVWQPRASPAPATDDHPFPYLKQRSLPRTYVVALALILLVSVLGVRAAAGPLRVMAPYVDLFFMGAAFLLLETKSVVQFALLFGTTWIVNAFVFFGVLVAVLLAIEVTARARLRRPYLVYALLFGSLALAWAVPTRSLLGLAFAPRLAAAIALTFVPIFLANLVFAERFRSSESSTTAFGANLIGAMVGGVLEYAALIVGYRDLVVAVGVLYGLAILAGRLELRPALVGMISRARA